MLVICDYLGEFFKQHGYDCKITHQNIWETRALPSSVDLLLQLLPAFPASEVDCPSISIKPMLLDLDHPPTITRILEVMKERCPSVLRPAPGKTLSPVASGR